MCVSLFPFKWVGSKGKQPEIRSHAGGPFNKKQTQMSPPISRAARHIGVKDRPSAAGPDVIVSSDVCCLLSSPILWVCLFQGTPDPTQRWCSFFPLKSTTGSLRSQAKNKTNIGTKRVKGNPQGEITWHLAYVLRLRFCEVRWIECKTLCFQEKRPP